VILMAERTSPPNQPTGDSEPICASCFRRESWCQSTAVQRLEPHEFNAVSETWEPSDAAGLDGRPNGIHRQQVRGALSEANVLTDEQRAERFAARRRRPVDAETGQEVAE